MAQNIVQSPGSQIFRISHRSVTWQRRGDVYASFINPHRFKHFLQQLALGAGQQMRRITLFGINHEDH